MKLIFNEVGGGDSIILEWIDEGYTHIGIIDANLKEGKINPTLQYLIENDITFIDFIIISHPHEDHYSGVLELLHHCAAKQIQIGLLCHTMFCHFSNLQSAMNSRIARKGLEELALWKRRYTEGSSYDCAKMIARECYVLRGCQPIRLTSKINLTFLLPTEVEYESFISKAYKGEPDNNQNASGAGNILSTFIRIGCDEWYFLLTSDSTIEPTKKLGYAFKNEENNFFAGKLILAQSPHHGAKANHSKIFWRERKHDRQTPIVISNAKDDPHHPDLTVVENFNQSNYEIFSTNSSDALHGRVPRESLSNEITVISALEVLGESVPGFQLNDKNNGKKVFIFDGIRFVYQQI